MTVFRATGAATFAVWMPLSTRTVKKLVELPCGYGKAWTNNLGEYVLSADPNFNPNL
jgi:hypothetical protein